MAVYFDAASKAHASLDSLPLGAAEMAGYVEAVLPDGSAVVLKDTHGKRGPIATSTEPGRTKS